jgi:murein DD-endopeptidase MepM/ murein hydrolase activator NlpD
LTRPPVAQTFPRSRRTFRTRFLVAFLGLPLLLGVLAVPAAAPSPVYGDELADAKAQQAELRRRIEQQRALVASINASQERLEGRIAATKSELEGITDDLAATRRRVDALEVDIEAIQASYEGLVASLAELDAQLADIEAQEAAKREELRIRKEVLAQRVRHAWEAERTSLLETFLSGAPFTDMLARMSSQLDAAEQDRALAQQIATDRATLLELHRTVESTRADTNLLRQQTAVQKQKLDRRMAELQDQRARLKALERAAKEALAEQREHYAELAADKRRLQAAIEKTQAARKALQRKIDRLIAREFDQGNIPSQYNGTLRWPMSGTISGDYGCTSFLWYPPGNGCEHFHNGIDIVAPYGTKVRAAGAGRVVYCGWNYADGADPAWIVIIAHASSLTTWYAHMIPGCPARSGEVVRQGQVIGREGNTGRSTGAHLHWMVQYNGEFVNPRLFT